MVRLCSIGIGVVAQIISLKWVEMRFRQRFELLLEDLTVSPYLVLVLDDLVYGERGD